MKLKTRLCTLLLALTPVLTSTLPLPGPLAARPAQAAQHPVLVVENATQLLDAIGPNRTIVLRPNTYVIGGKLPIKHSQYFEYDKDTGGPVIKNVSNLRLIGTDVRSTKVVIRETFPNVLSFKNSSNIRIQSLEIGHVPQSQAICLGAVLSFVQSRDIQLTDLNLFGSGTFGLWLENTRRLRISDSVIKESSQGMAFLYESQQIHFSNSTFVDNAGGFNLSDNSEAMVTGSRIVHNHARDSKDYTKALFSVKGAGRLLVSDSILTDNSASALLGEGAGHIRLRGNYMIRNRYTP